MTSEQWGRDTRRLASLEARFESQATFAAGYSPLYARLFGIIRAWLAGEDGVSETFTEWLLKASAGRSAFDVTVLLVAGIHLAVLERWPGTAALARYYPTAGGRLGPEEPGLADALYRTIFDNGARLMQFLQQANVQTNETGRGLVWLLPLSYCAGPAVHLVDLGSSAGLNLVADRRAFRLEDEYGRHLATFGEARQPQFLVRCTGEYGTLARQANRPTIVARQGCDVMPFRLESTADERLLQAYVWADQPERVARLQEGIAAYQAVQQSGAPVHLSQLSLPEDLPAFLATLEGSLPLVLYNTYITIYLPERGAGLRPAIAHWARHAGRPVFWLQWEPAYGSGAAPHYGWCAWTAELWLPNGDYRAWRLGWVHPHGTHVQFEKGLTAWVDFWAERGRSSD